MMDLHAAASALGGDVCGRNVLAPGPGHSPHDRSLCVTFDGDKIVVHSFAGNDWLECRKHVERLLGCRSAPTRPDRIP
jgi:putative DNA primase/helicase